jgi:hypothetical protein
MAVRRPGPPRWEGGFPKSRVCVDGLVEIVACFDPLSEWKVGRRSVKSVCIPSSIETIASDCFFHCRILSILTFESCCKVSSLGAAAWSNCPYNELPDSLTIFVLSVLSCRSQFQLSFVPYGNPPLSN